MENKLATCEGVQKPHDAVNVMEWDINGNRINLCPVCAETLRQRVPHTTFVLVRERAAGEHNW